MNITGLDQALSRLHQLPGKLLEHSSIEMAEILARRPYAIYLEYGTRRMSARPFLIPAAREADYLARMIRAMQEAIQ